MVRRPNLEAHLNRVQKCNHKYILTTKEIPTDLFATKFQNKFFIFPLRCKSFFCEKCGKIKVKQYRKKILDNLGEETWRHLILTTINVPEKKEQTLAQLEHDWNKLRTLLTKKFGKFRYVKTIESGKFGMLHFHVMINKFIPQRFIMLSWKRYCGATNVSISRPRKHSDVAFYLSNYVSKSLLDFDFNSMMFENKKRRISFSNDFVFTKKEKDHYKLFLTYFFSDVKLISTLREMFCKFNFTFTDFDFENLPPPFKDYFKTDFVEELNSLQKINTEENYFQNEKTFHNFFFERLN